MKIEVKFYLSDAMEAIKRAEIDAEKGMSIGDIINICMQIENSGIRREDLINSTVIVDNKTVEKTYCLSGGEKTVMFLNMLIGG